jgi:serine/threonine-protein kinase
VAWAKCIGRAIRGSIATWLKILPEAFAADADRVARFRREAKVLASLNHPYIATIYGLEDAGGAKALMMELVEGQDLAQMLARGAIPLHEALPIAKQIAEALEAAHEQGIIHRDLKPANVKVRPDGTVKVLDFGLAKAMESSVTIAPNVTTSPTVTSPAITGVGVLLGTAAYMSPEQARGKSADKRGDVWAYGCLLYEMFTGHRPFAGEGVSDTLAAVLRDEPDWQALPHDLPVAIGALLRGCLAKDRRKRIADLSTARFVIDATDLLQTQAATRPWRRVVTAGVVAVLAAGAVGLALWSAMRAASPPGPVVRFVVPLPQGQNFGSASLPVLAISPDGEHLVYAASGRLYLRSMSDGVPRPIAGTEGRSEYPVFSPDGQSIAFFTAQGGDASGDLPRGVIKRVPLAGGTPLTVCETAYPFGMSWGADGLVFGQASKGVMRVSADGGEPQLLVRVDNDEVALRPQVLPDRRAVMFTLASDLTNLLRPLENPADSGWDKARVVVQQLDTGERKTIVEGATDGRYLSTGHVVYAVGGTLRARSFDVTRPEVTGAAAAVVVEGVARTRYGPRMTGLAQYSVSTTGSLVYVSGPASTSSPPPRDLALYDRNGRVETLNLPPMLYESPRTSPNGQEVAVATADASNVQVWLYDLVRKSPPRQLTLQGKNRYPIWSADGRRVAFQSDREGDLAIFSQPADGSRAADRLTTPERGTEHIPQAWSPDDEYLLFSAATGSSVSLETFAARTKTIARLADIRSVTLTPSAVFSPDGAWVAYEWNESSQPRVRIQSFSRTGVVHQIPVDARHPRWSTGGTELFFSQGPRIFAIAVSAQPTFTFGSPSLLVKDIPMGGSQRQYDVVDDGKRFVGIAVAAGYTPSTAAAIRNIDVVLNWAEELKARVSAQ